MDAGEFIEPRKAIDALDFAGHNAKWTTDIGFGLEALTVGTFPNGVAVAPVTGWREDLTVEDGQIVIRSQLQILFCVPPTLDIASGPCLSCHTM